MREIQFFQHIPAPYRKSLIYTRLGYEKTNTRIEPERRKQIERWIEAAEALCDIVVVFRYIDLKKVYGGGVYMEEEITIHSNSLAALLQNSVGVVLMAATAGCGITEEIMRLQKSGEISKALVYDATASEITDAGLDWLMGYLKQPLMRKGQTLTHMRYSPGYGDLDLSNQQMIYELLELRKWGVEMTPKYILVPEKSVTAIVGIEAPRD